jgi:glucose-1-phosphate adenylyltransferase
MSAQKEVLAVILGGGRGSRLFPLTERRSKPDIPIAGKYRLIDIPISNCINSSIYRIAVLTQFNSVSLHHHISRTYQSNLFQFNSGWVQIWAAEQTTDNTDWYLGTADAVRKQILEIQETHAENVLILAGDQLYRMDYSQLIKFHQETIADVTVAVHPVSKADASRFGILKTNSNHRIVKFAEKPSDPALLPDLVSSNDPSCPFLCSMGIYLFRTEVLFDLLQDKNFKDFGDHVIPKAINCYRVHGFGFDGYWEDIGTIRSFYESNLALTYPDPPFNFYEADHPIYYDTTYLPGSTIENCSMENVILSEGCWVKEARISHSIVGVRSQIRQGVEISDSILMGADYYDSGSNPADNNKGPLGIGRNSKIVGAIIDRNARVGENVVILPFPRGTNLDQANWVVRDGIVVIPKDAIVPSGSYIGPENRLVFSEQPIERIRVQTLACIPKAGLFREEAQRN